MTNYINAAGAYCEGDMLDPTDVEVPARPDPTYAWNGTIWAQSAALLLPAYKAQAQAALDRSDTTVLRCTEVGVAVPAAWAAYRKALRAIVSPASAPDPTLPLPVQPAFPAGT